MPIYRAPVDDYRFLLNEVLELEKQRDLPGFADLDAALVDDILGNAGKFCEEVLAAAEPVRRRGRLSLRERRGHHAQGIQRRLQGLLRGRLGRAWARPKKPAAPGMPPIITMAVSEMGMSANQSLAMYPMLTAGAYGALLATGADWMKRAIAPKMVSGEWAGTMCLTEPGCGTDLRLMKTKAVEQPDGTYKMNGTKIFISGGDQDLTDNIIHMAIAKIPDENGQIHDDLSTVNFFMVPKFLVKEDGSMGAQERRQHRRHRTQDGHQGPGDLRAEFRRRHRLAAGTQARAAEAGREALVLRRHGGHVRDDECRAPGCRHPGHRAGRSRLPERLCLCP